MRGSNCRSGIENIDGHQDARETCNGSHRRGLEDGLCRDAIVRSTHCAHFTPPISLRMQRIPQWLAHKPLMRRISGLLPPNGRSLANLFPDPRNRPLATPDVERRIEAWLEIATPTSLLRSFRSSIAYCSTSNRYLHSRITVVGLTLLLRSMPIWRESGMPSNSRKRT